MYQNVVAQAQFFGRYLRLYKLKLFSLLVLLLAGTGIALIGPQIVARFIDTAEGGGALDQLTRLALLYVGVAIGEQLLRLISTYLSEDISWRTTNQLRSDLFNHVLALDLTFHQKYTAGNMIERIDGDVSELAKFFSTMIINFLGNALLLFGILTFFFIQAWQIGLLYVVFSLVAVYLISRIRHIATKYWSQSREASAELHGFIEEHLQGVEDVRSRGAETYVMNKLYFALNDLFRKERVANVRGAFVFSPASTSSRPSSGSRP
jgi:ABC-type multidrug transport system fused ATPase/permease subunit